MMIGKRIKEIRKAQKMQLSELAEKSGVQIATLSRIEHLKMTGTLHSHVKIAQALGVDISELYSDMVPRESKGKEEVNQDVFTPDNAVSYQILCNKTTTKKLFPLLLNIEANNKTKPAKDLIGSEKFIYVLDGSINLFLRNQPIALKKGQSITFSSSQEYYFENKHNSNAKLLSVTTPVNL